MVAMALHRIKLGISFVMFVGLKQVHIAGQCNYGMQQMKYKWYGWASIANHFTGILIVIQQQTLNTFLFLLRHINKRGTFFAVIA